MEDASISSVRHSTPSDATDVRMPSGTAIMIAASAAPPTTATCDSLPRAPETPRPIATAISSAPTTKGTERGTITLHTTRAMPSTPAAAPAVTAVERDMPFSPRSPPSGVMILLATCGEYRGEFSPVRAGAGQGRRRSRMTLSRTVTCSPFGSIASRSRSSATTTSQPLATSTASSSPCTVGIGSCRWCCDHGGISA